MNAVATRLFTPAFRAQLQQRASSRLTATTTTTPTAAAAAVSKTHTTTLPTPRFASSASASKKPGSLPRSGSGSGSSNNKSKNATPVLERPDKFRPPSHPQRLVKGGGGGPPVRNYGPELSATERAAQAKRKYPNMMPPEGTAMHWFLTNRSIHVWISMSVLIGFALWSVLLNFKQNSPFADQLPSARDMVAHPLDSLALLGRVYRLHSEHTSAVTAEKRRRAVEEVQKRRAYRVAHGLDSPDAPGLPPSRSPSSSSATAAADVSTATAPTATPDGSAILAVSGAEAGANGLPPRPELESNDQPSNASPKRYKKWFGIW